MMNLDMIRALDENSVAELCEAWSHWPQFGAVTDTLMAPDFEPKEGVRASTGGPPMTKTCPLPDGSATSAVPGKRPYRFTDEDRAKSQETRKGALVETALVCDACYAQTTCKAFKPGSACTIVDTFKAFDNKTVSDVIAKLREIISALETRAWQNLYFEKLDGGVARRDVTEMFAQLIEYHALLARLYAELSPSKGPVRLNGDNALTRIFGEAHD